MNGFETRKFEMLARVRDLGAGHSAAFPPASLAATLLATITAAVDAVTQHAAAQIGSQSASRRATASRTLARLALRDDLEAISRTARALSAEIPALDRKFRMPSSPRDQTLLGTARAFVADATPLKPEFVRHELPDDFLDTLTANIGALEQALSAQRRSREERKTATASIEDRLASALTAVHKLDAVLRNKYRHDAVMLTAWEQASRIQRGAHGTRAKAPADETATAPAA